MRKTLLLTIILLCSLRILAQDLSKIDIKLQQEMTVSDKTDKLRINILLNAQYDQLTLRIKAETFRNKEAKRNFVVNELKQFSKETQKNLLALLIDLSETSPFSKEFGEVFSIQSFWISNSINCYASIEAIEKLSYHQDVLLIGLDNYEYLLPEEQNSNQEDQNRETTYNVSKVKADLVWELGYTGEGVVVGVIDSGINYYHTDLQGNMWEHPDYPYHGYNYIDNNNNPLDDNGHGTHCAGTVAGNGASGSQTGVAPDAKVMAIKVLDNEGYGTLSTISNGIQFAVENGAHILSMSLGFSGGGDQTARVQLRKSMENTLEAGIIASVAAGNEGNGLGPMLYPVPNNIGLPGNCPSPWLHPAQTLIGGLSAVVCVGATDSNDLIAAFSSKGPVTWQSIPNYMDYKYNPGIGLIRPDVVAPGVNVKSLRHDSNTSYKNLDGTSMATPCVAGIMALMLSKNPDLTPADICEILQTTALPLSATKNNIYGAGRVNAYDAVNAGLPIDLTLESFIINDENENNNGRLNPGEQVFLTVSLKNEKTRFVENVNATLITNNELVTINQGNADFGTFSDLENITVQNAFSFTLSPDAIAHQEISFKLLINSGESICESNFKITVYNYLFEILDVVIPKEDPLSAGETSDVWFYLKNSGNEDVVDITGKVFSSSYFLTINEDEQFYGQMNCDQYKYRPFNITISPNTPSSLTKFNVKFLITDELGNETEISSHINVSNSANPPQNCAAIDIASTEIQIPNIILSWEEPDHSVPVKYLIYCNDVFLTETTSTSYIHENVEPGIYNYCIEVLYENGCTSGLFCFESINIAGIYWEQNQTIVFPNPFKNEIYINSDNSVKSVEILNTTGQKVENVSFNGKTISTGKLAIGIYFVIIESYNGEKVVNKMVKK